MTERDIKATTPPLRGTPPKEGNEGSTSNSETSVSVRGTPPREGNEGVRHTRSYQSLPFNPLLKERAKALRQAGNLSEVLLWNQLKKGQIKGLDFDRQKIIGNYIVDFYCAEKNAVIEVDGSSHDDKAEYDAQRDAYLSGLGLNVVRILDRDVKQNMAGVMDFLRQQLFPVPDKHPTPSVEGRTAAMPCVTSINAAPSFPSVGGVDGDTPPTPSFPSVGGVDGEAGRGG